MENNSLISRFQKIDYSLFSAFAAVALLLSLTFSMALAEISFFVLFIFWFLARVAQKPQTFSNPKAVWGSLILFVALVVFTAFFSEYPKDSKKGILKIYEQVSIFTMIYDCMRKERNRSLFEKFILAIVWLVTVNGLCQYTFGRDFLRWKTPEMSGAGLRVSASFTSYGMLGAFLITVTPYVLTLTGHFKNIKKDTPRFILTAVVTAGLLILLFLTRSRGAILAFALAILVILILRKKFLWLFLLMLAGGGFAASLPRNMIIHLDADLKEQSIVERFCLWDRAVQVIQAKPLTGTGINTYTNAHAKYDKRQNWRVKNYYAHNGYLQLAAETGIPCILSFLAFLGIYFMVSLKRLKEMTADISLRWGLLTGLLAYLLFCAVDTALQSPQPVMIFWFMLGLQLAYAFPQKESEPLKQQILDRRA